MAKILLIEPNLMSQSAIVEKLVKHDVLAVADANLAIEAANQQDFDAVIMELSLAGHSGMEFLYEFRTYLDWEQIPVIIYSGIRLDDEILTSSAWEKLAIYKYLYKPSSSLRELEKFVNTVLAAKHEAHSD